MGGRQDDEAQQGCRNFGYRTGRRGQSRRVRLSEGPCRWICLTAAPAATPKTSATTAPPKATSAPTAPAPAKTVYVPAAPAPAQPAYFTNGTAVVQQFCQDINNGDYSAAWAAGYDTIVSVSLGTLNAFGSDQVQASLSALQSDGTANTYEGTYTVSKRRHRRCEHRADGLNLIRTFIGARLTNQSRGES
jgi:hypothetical protein